MRPVSRLIWLAVTLLLLLVIPTGRLQAAFWLNLAQVDRLKGNDRESAVLFADSLAANPENQRVRGEAVKALARVGDYETAVSVLRPLLGPTTEVSQRIDLLLATRQADEALLLYSALDVPPPLSYQAAAQMANAYLKRDGNLPMNHEKATALLVQATAFSETSPEFQVLGEQFTEADFWPTETGQRLRNTLYWRSQTQPAERVLPYSHGKSFASVIESERVETMLGVAPGSVRLGNELVLTGSGEDRHPKSDMVRVWMYSLMTKGDPWNRAMFVLGTDREQSLGGMRALRIDGVYVERRSDREPARAGFWLWDAPPTLAVGVPYVISFAYRTDQVRYPGAAVYLHFDDPKSKRVEQFLPATSGRWKQVTMILWNRSNQDEALRPLLRSYSEGSVWFNNFSVRVVLVTESIAPRDLMARVDDFQP